MFETKVCLVNKYDEIVCELEKDGYFYKFPMDFAKNPLLDIGDEYKVVEIETEFDSHNCVTMGDIKPLLSYFDIRNNDEINNVVFVPNDYFIKRFVEGGESFEYKR